jgi:hypothetical protein
MFGMIALGQHDFSQWSEANSEYQQTIY